MKMQKAQWGALRGEKHQTQDLNPSPVACSKLCKEMSEKPGRTPSLEEASTAVTTAQTSGSLKVTSSNKYLHAFCKAGQGGKLCSWVESTAVLKKIPDLLKIIKKFNLLKKIPDLLKIILKINFWSTCPKEVSTQSKMYNDHWLASFKSWQ